VIARTNRRTTPGLPVAAHPHVAASLSATDTACHSSWLRVGAWVAALLIMSSVIPMTGK
jgi:hypothetical protein